MAKLHFCQPSHSCVNSECLPLLSSRSICSHSLFGWWGGSVHTAPGGVGGQSIHAERPVVSAAMHSQSIMLQGLQHMQAQLDRLAASDQGNSLQAQALRRQLNSHRPMPMHHADNFDFQDQVLSIPCTNPCTSDAALNLCRSVPLRLHFCVCCRPCLQLALYRSMHLERGDGTKASFEMIRLLKGRVALRGLFKMKMLSRCKEPRTPRTRLPG